MPSFQVPYAAPAGFQWQLATNSGGFTIPQLVPTSFSASSPLDNSGNTPVVTDGPSSSFPSAPTTIAAHLTITFDTIGQLIYATMGHASMPGRYLWVKGINESGDIISDGVITFAAALSAPIDPLEESGVVSIKEGATQIFSSVDGITLPPTWDAVKQALLTASLLTAVVYPGTEGQEPDPTILADKGASLVSAYRGIRYIVMQDYPATSLPPINIIVERKNDVPKKEKARKGSDPTPPTGGTFFVTVGEILLSTGESPSNPGVIVTLAAPETFTDYVFTVLPGQSAHTAISAPYGEVTVYHDTVGIGSCEDFESSTVPGFQDLTVVVGDSVVETWTTVSIQQALVETRPGVCEPQSAGSGVTYRFASSNFVAD